MSRSMSVVIASGAGGGALFPCRHQGGVSRRLAYLLAAPLLPPLLLARIAARVVASRRRRGRLLAALPLLVPVAVVYVWGEWLGYLLGAGDALGQVE